MGNDRLAILPSRTNYVQIKLRIASAVKGLRLLKNKRDALELRLRELKVRLNEERKYVEQKVSEALFSTARAKFMGTDFRAASVQGVERADVYLNIKDIKVVGITLPTYHLVMKPPTSFPLTGLSNGGREVENMRVKFRDALRSLVTVASLELSVKALEATVHNTNMRINALEFVLVPRMQNTQDFIEESLDEHDREDFFRIKLSQAKQKAKKKKPEDEKAAQKSKHGDGNGAEDGDDEDPSIWEEWNRWRLEHGLPKITFAFFKRRISSKDGADCGRKEKIDATPVDDCLTNRDPGDLCSERKANSEEEGECVCDCADETTDDCEDEGIPSCGVDCAALYKWYVQQCESNLASSCQTSRAHRRQSADSEQPCGRVRIGELLARDGLESSDDDGTEYAALNEWRAERGLPPIVPNAQRVSAPCETQDQGRGNSSHSQETTSDSESQKEETN